MLSAANKNEGREGLKRGNCTRSEYWHEGCSKVMETSETPIFVSQIQLKEINDE
jgi:hypothetical protein